MKRILLLFFVWLYSVPIAYTQIIIEKDLSKINFSTNQKLKNSIKDFKSYELDLLSLHKAIKNKKESTDLILPLEKDSLILTIFKNNLKSHKYLSSENGKQLTLNQSDEIITYSGYVNNDESNYIRLTISDNIFKGYIFYKNEFYLLGQLKEFDSGNIKSSNSIIVYKPNDILEAIGNCGVPEIQEQSYMQKNSKNNSQKSTLSQTCKLLELATDADFEYFQLFGPNTNNDILATINMIQGVYFNTFNVDIQVVNQNVWTISNDPYTGNPSTDPGSLTLVTELRNFWETNNQGVRRDLVHLFTGKDYGLSGILGRVFDIGTICSSPDKSYGFTKGRINQFLTTAHEIGHNFGGIHSDGQNCGTATASIMCQGTKQDPPYFSTTSISRIGGFINSNSSCLNPLETIFIEGSSNICSNPETYTVSGLQSGAIVTWSISPTSGVANLSISGNTATLTKTGNGSLQLIATVHGVCGGITLTPLTIKVGTPVFDIPYFTNSENGMPYWCSNATGNSFTLDNTDHNGTYEAKLLSYPSLNVFATNSNAHPGTDVFGYVPTGYYVFQIRATNNCGTSDWVETEVESLDCSVNYRGSNFNIYPNPANTELTIEIANKTSNKNKDIQLLNNKGEILISSLLKSGEAKLVLDTKGIKDGTYFLHITEGKETIKKQIIIKH